MTQRISDFLNLESASFDRIGAFNGFLDIDTQLFIDPRLLKTTSAPELRKSYNRIVQHFTRIIKLLTRSHKPGDAFWRNAAKLLLFHEPRGLCIGYSSRSTAGSGIGVELQSQLLETAKCIIDAGNDDPELFELMGLFEENIGADRIGDMIANIIMPNLLAYSDRVFREIGVCVDIPYLVDEKEYYLPTNPYNQAHIILVPIDVLNDLPLAHSHEGIEQVTAFNEELRNDLNGIIGDIWDKKRTPKSVYKRAILNNPHLLAKLIEVYRNMSPSAYDFDLDPNGQHLWYEHTKQAVRKNPLELVLGPHPESEDVFDVVIKICQKFKKLVEYNGLHTLLYKDRACQEPKHEEAAQKVFYGVASSYCEANNLDLSPEINSGRGPVDFKVSRGFDSRILVEIKLSSNKKLVHGFSTQLEEYAKAEQPKHLIYLVIDVGGYSKQRWEEFRNVIADAKFSDKPVPTLIHVDSKRKPPASKV